MKKCDIIIPIYNAYDCVDACIKSVIENTNLEENRLILIDDKSSDKRIQPLLKKYAKENNGILALSNEQNLGFVKTVNKGMLESFENDVLLLNSDTEVTKNWLTKIKDCAYSSPNIATVTPLSNNATLASVPKSFEANELPKGYTLEEMSNLVEKCSHNYFPEIPTGHGFCLFIKREALDKVGLFDARAYGKGYGEENDFCFRCYEYGYRHVLCDNTYILHKESQSFLDSKVELIKDGLRVLEEKYPVYKRKLDLWVANRPIDYISQNIAFTLGNKEERPNILLIIHDWKSITTNLGGTSLHVWDLIKNLRDKYNFHIFAPEDGIYKVYSYFKDTEISVKYCTVYPAMTDYNFYNNSYKKLLNEIIENYKISYVHIHHIKNHYFDLINVFQEHNLKYAITLHDFYAQCPLINKLYENNNYCGNPTQEKCNDCLYNVIKKPMEISSWQESWEQLLQNADKIITPSLATKMEILKKYPNINIEVIEHGIDILKEKSKLTLNDGINDIAFIGAIGIHKGSQYLYNFIQRKNIDNCRIHLFGISNIKYENSENFINHGQYKREDLKNLLRENNIKLVCLLSIWPETYSYTMTEAISCGIPVVSFNMGAIEERIKKYNLGWILEIDEDSDKIAKQIEKILEDKKGYNKVIKSINNYKIVSSKEMAKSYDKIYKENSKCCGELSDEISNTLINNSMFINSPSYPDYSWIFQTWKWKMFDKIKIPKTIKKFLKRN